MKKVFLFAAMAAMVLVSCGKKDTKDSEKGKEQETQGTDEITIDGDFSDWASLSKTLYLFSALFQSADKNRPYSIVRG